MNAWLFVPIVAALLVAWCAFAIGSRLLQRLRFSGAVEQTVFSVAAGLAVLSLLTFVVGVCGGLYRWPMWAGLAAIAVVPGRRPKLPSWRWLPLLLVLGFLALPALYPPTTADSLLYHLPHARSYARWHEVRPPWEVRWAVMPLFAEMLLTLQFTLAGELAAQLNQVLMLALVTGAIYAWGARWFSPTAGALGAAAFAGNPIAVFLGTTAYTDLTLTLYCTLALLAAANWRESNERGWLLAAGAFAGCAASCKYTGLFAVAAVGAVVLLERNRADLGRYLLATCVAAPFYRYIVFYTGNPVWPFYSGLFGYKSWNAADLANQLEQLQRAGAGRSLGAFLLLPLRLAINSGAFRPETEFTGWCVMALPLALAAAWFDRRIRALLAAVLAYTVVWFLGAQYGRYLAPIMPVLFVATAGGVAWLLARAPRVERVAARPQLLIPVCLFLLLPAFQYTAELVKASGPLPTDATQRRDYLANKVGGYLLAVKLNDTEGSRYSLYSFQYSLGLFTEGRSVGDWFGPARFERLWPAFDRQTWCRPESSQILMRTLGELQVDHLLIPRAILPAGYDQCAWFHAHFHERWSEPDKVLFQVFRDAR